MAAKPKKDADFPRFISPGQGQLRVFLLQRKEKCGLSHAPAHKKRRHAKRGLAV
jgi:hypothetical protein